MQPMTKTLPSLLAAGLALTAPTVAGPPVPALRALPPGAVTLAPGPLRAAFERNLAYVRSFEPDRLLFTFRKEAGLPTPGAPLGGWESPDVELRRHSIGHYLSASALLLARVEDAEIRGDLTAVVEGLAACQRAIGTGWLSAFPEEFLDRVEQGKPVWAPYYTLHKILAGLIAVASLPGDANRSLATESLRVARGFADRIETRSAKLDEAAMQRMLGNEFGGMEEALFDLFALTGEERYAALARRFRKEAFLEPLASGGDPLPGLHANTHLAQILGQVRAFELTGDERARRIVDRFWNVLRHDHSYATGGSNAGEYWGPPGRLANTLCPTNQEFCTSYNWSRITRSLFLLSGHLHYADELERVFHNGITVSQHPASGMFIYYLPLATGLAKDHGTPFDTMTCCYGTGIEAYAQLEEGIAFERGDELVIARYAPSAIEWQSPNAGRVRVRQETDFPATGRVRIVVDAVERAEPFGISMRIPWWTTDAATATLNGTSTVKLPHSPDASDWCGFRRAWAAGDRIELDLPMPLRVVTMPDDPTLGAILAGPIVLAGLVDEPTDEVPIAPITGDKLTPSTWLEPTGTPLVWRTKGQAVERTFIPLERVVSERYGVYWPFGVPGGARESAYRAAVAARDARERRTLDRVEPGDEASERAHDLDGRSSRSGVADGRHWRDATKGGHFAYRLAVDPDRACTLAVTYSAKDGGARVFDILVDGVRIATERLVPEERTSFRTVEYAIPEALTKGKSSVHVRFEPAPNGEIAGGVFGLRTLRPS